MHIHTCKCVYTCTYIDTHVHTVIYYIHRAGHRRGGVSTPAKARPLKRTKSALVNY